MTTGRLRVTVVPVAVQQAGLAGRPTFVGLLDSKAEWATSPLHDRADTTAEGLLQQLLPESLRFLDHSALTLRPVTFSEDADSGCITLLYTVALPMALTAAEETAGRWIHLVQPAAGADEARAAGDSAISAAEYAETLLQHWRKVLEDTAGGLLFLARYWTMPQLRDVYSGVWGYEQDAASFNRWADPRRGGAFEHVVKCLEEDPSGVTDEIARVFAAASSPGAPGHGAVAGAHAGALLGARVDHAALAGWKAAASALRPKHRVGLTLDPAEVKAAPVSPRALVAAAARVAYQSSTRGPKPDWYTAAVEDPLEHRLDKLYLPRPGWMRREAE